MALAATFYLLSSVAALAGDIAVIVNKANTTDRVSFKVLVSVLTQEKKFWEGGTKIYLIMQEAGSEEKRVMLERIYRMNGQQLKKFWLGKIFSGDISSFPKTLSSNEAVRQFVSQIPGSIGFVDASFVNDSVKVLRIDGKAPGDEDYALRN